MRGVDSCFRRNDKKCPKWTFGGAGITENVILRLLLNRRISEVLNTDVSSLSLLNMTGEWIPAFAGMTIGGAGITLKTGNTKTLLLLRASSPQRFRPALRLGYRVFHRVVLALSTYGVFHRVVLALLTYGMFHRVVLTLSTYFPPSPKIPQRLSIYNVAVKFVCSMVCGCTKMQH